MKISDYVIKNKGADGYKKEGADSPSSPINLIGGKKLWVED